MENVYRLNWLEFNVVFDILNKSINGHVSLNYFSVQRCLKCIWFGVCTMFLHEPNMVYEYLFLSCSLFLSLSLFLYIYIYIYIYIFFLGRVDFEGKLKRRRFKFLISFIKFKSFAARTFRTQYIICICIRIHMYVSIYIYSVYIQIIRTIFLSSQDKVQS